MMLYYVAPVWVAVGDPFGIDCVGACPGIGCVAVCAGGIMFGMAKAPLFSGLKRYSNTFFIQSFSFFIVSKTTKRVYYPRQYFQLTEIDCLMLAGFHYSLCLFQKANWWENLHLREHLILTTTKMKRKIIIQILQLTEILLISKKRFSTSFLTWENRL